MLPQHPDARAPHVAWAVASGADKWQAGHQQTGVLAQRRRDTRDALSLLVRTEGGHVGVSKRAAVTSTK